jgi:hypothetical protein
MVIMIRFFKGLSTPVLVGLAVLTSILPKAHGQSRAIHLRPSLPARPITANASTIRQMAPFRTTIRQTTPFRTTIRQTTPFRTTIRQATPFLSPRDLRFDPFLRRELRFDRFFGAGNFGFGLSGTPFGSAFGSLAGSSFGVGGLGGGVIANSGLTPYPVPYPVYANPYEFTNPYDLPGSPDGTNRQDRSSADEQRQRSQREQLSRSLNNPPANEIWSGKALNDVLADLRQFLLYYDPASLRAFLMPLDDDGLKHINVTRGAGNIALLRNQGRLTWPVALKDAAFQVEREKLTARALEAVRQAKSYGQVDAGTILQMTAGLESLDQQLERKVRDVLPGLYVEAKTFLNHFADAVTALRQEDVGSHFTGKYALRTRNVPDLVKHLTEQGLQFAPALPGDKAAYTVLHDALATYDQALRAQTTMR